MNPLEYLLSFLCRLKTHKINFRIEHNRDESLMVLIAVPGERIEVEFFADGTIELEKFGSSAGVLSNEESSQEIERLFELHGE